MFTITTATKKVASLKKRIRAVQGGTSASKTISILQILIDKAQRDLTPTVTSIVSESLPHLRKGAMRDFLNILDTHGYFDDNRWNKTDSIYTFETGSIIEFFGADQPSKVRGPRRDRLFMNECNNMALETFEQLEVRTRECIYLDWNPTTEFWFYTDVLNSRDDVDHLIINYKDNEALEKTIVDSIEQRKDRKSWWQVYGLGQLGEVEGKIYKDWRIIDDVPHEAKLMRFGLDFGYTNDPTAIVAVYQLGTGEIILDEILFQKGMQNSQIAGVIQNQEQVVLTIADSAEPKSIDDIAMYGVPIVATVKGRDSVKQGIDIVQDQRISVTKRSTNVIKEYRNYLWEVDKNGKVLNVPEHEFSHCFSPDTEVKTIDGFTKIKDLVGKEGFVYSRDGRIEKFHSVKETRKNAETVKVYCENGTSFEVTPDHLILLSTGEWCEADLLLSEDRILLDMYETNLQWTRIYQISMLKVLQRIRRWKKDIYTSIYMGVRKRTDIKRPSYPPQRSQSIKQQNREFGDDSQISASSKSYDSRTSHSTARVDKKNYTTYKEVARIRRGEDVAQATWEEDGRDTRTFGERMCSLPQEFYDKTVCKIRAILSPKLQNESKTTKVVRVERGFCPVTYNMEVDRTHCLVISGGIIAHNSMDAIRYAITSLPKLVIPLTAEQQATKRWQAAMKRKKELVKNHGFHTTKRQRKFLA